MADMMVMGGYKEAGYDTIIIDDCWLDHHRWVQSGFAAFYHTVVYLKM